jgi:uncharacterized NAD(P)/FAD-binding protein YdhS
VRPLHVGIVGGGFGGAAVASALIDRLATGSSISVFEPASQLAGGTAYGQCSGHHLLNVSEDKLRALPDGTRSFAAWVHRFKGKEARKYLQDDGAYFFPRVWFAEYMRAELNWRQVMSGGRVHLLHVRQAALAIASTETGDVRITSANGCHHDVDAVVVALGNAPAPNLPTAARFPARDGGQPGLPHVIQNPWAPCAIARLAKLPIRRIAIAGTGLTMADIVMTLRLEGFDGQVVAVSRNGYLPQRSRGRLPGFVADTFPPCRSLADVFHAIRVWCRESRLIFGDWRPGFEFARLNVSRIWGNLPQRERRRFRGRLRALWDTHRYQMPPSVHDALEDWLHSGRLAVRRGEVVGVVQGGMAVRHAGVAALVECDAVVNATGPDRSFSTSYARLSKLLGGTGIDGLQAERDGVPVSMHGEISDVLPALQGRLWAAGTIARCTFGEMTTVTDIGVLAQRLVDHLVDRLAIPRRQRFSIS